MSQKSQSTLGEGNTNLPRNRARRWCFTLNNYTDDDVSLISLYFEKEKYFIFGKEVGENGTPHLQGYVEFNNQKDFSTLIKIIPRIHWEKAKGDRNSNIKYCSKDGDIKKKKIECQHEVEDRLRIKAIKEMHEYTKQRGFDPAMIEYLLRKPDNNSDWTINEKLGIKI
nr:MAG: replication associated protein [Cressdnaviricota sp.]